MRAHKTRASVEPGREMVLVIPDDFPAGEAEVIVLAVERPRDGDTRSVEMDEWLDGLIADLPDAPDLPLSSFDREVLCR